MPNLSRRDCLKLSLAGTVATVLQPFTAIAEAGTVDPLAQNAWVLAQSSNFHAVYDNPIERDAFFPFLRHVYHLYPEQDFHQLIQSTTAGQATDQAIYHEVQQHLNAITPYLASLRYALPALHQQKQEMLNETLQLLGSQTMINGYMEIGTTGRYLSVLRSSLTMTGDTILLHSQRPNYGVVDIVERGQFRMPARFVDMRNYAAIAPSDIPDGSLDLITNFIGFHHSPSENLDSFVRSLHRILRHGGRMIVRDHEVDSPEMNRRVALAHDVFNMGLKIDWTDNQQEIRHFTSLSQLRSYLEARGFRSEARELYQSGDPTKNALMLFTKV